ncbi:MULTISPECIES: SH3 domain-containing protein [Brevibacillus]|uniref:SH3 domain-containing protein n=1 Tax=Brevibacillus TaxID=55080 RepID=UPI000D0E4259|nr:MULTISPECIES: SH3 domain-containing protein [Brevibacillus]MED1946227.1 SH3 domain-containing protein [Brevibacillus formosus]MED1998851.1 SH3 domain-containing protein [Brevibacillus formosus]MED2084092.1 SH3 domain-containing protein [Brevibacillus formosus]PSK18137.1 N-acetylmuramoyl-L-alanine amidase [Brevibacillus sp. NRRL NRS-603]
MQDRDEFKKLRISERMSIVFVRQKILRSILTVVCAISLPVSAAWAAGSVQVTVDKLNVRSGPSLQDAIVTTLPNKTVLPVISTKNDWIQVKLPNGQSGWVANWLVSSQQQQQQKPATVSAKQVESTTTNLNVRSGPGQTYAVVQTINPGTRYPIVQTNGEWLQIQLNAGTKGWVANWLVKEVGAGQAVSPPATVSTPPTTNPAGTGSQPKPPAVQGASLILDFAPYVYATPDASTPAIGQLHAGEKITVLNRQNGWIQFPYDGVNAWLSTDQTNPNTSQPTLPENGNGNTQPQTGQPSSSSQSATVKTDGLNLRSEPNTTSAIQATLPAGSKLTVLEKQEDWYRINTADGKTGWVAGWHITVNQPSMPTPSGPYVTIMNPDTNVRSGPSTDHAVIKQVQPGEKYGIANKSGEWFQVNFPDGSTGYIAGWLVSANGAPAVVRSNDLAGKVIVVDAGHGGTDGGSTGSSFSTLEKTVNLQVSLLLRNKLEAAGAKVVMTRADDRKLTLQQRVDIAIQNQADIFVSVHHNTHPNSATNGSIIFYYSQGNSSKLASLVQTELVKATNYKDMNYRYGNYFVLRENPVPSILAEISFLSNYNDEIRARSEKQQDLAAEGLFKGIVQYFNTQSNQGG